MKLAVNSNPSIEQVTKPAILSATVNGGSTSHLRIVKYPQPLSFLSTSAPTLKWQTYPQGEVLVLSAGHTQDGSTVRFEIVFFVKPLTGQYDISENSDRNALTYYSDPVSGSLHKGVAGTLNLTYDENEETLQGSFFGTFDHGGEKSESTFPIDGQFLAYGCQWTKK